MRQLWSTILAFFKAFWRVIAFCVAIVGVLTLGPTVRDLPKSYGYTWEFLVWLDQQTVTYIFLLIAVLWIIWIDARPFVFQWLQKRRSSAFSISNRVYCETHRIENVENVYLSKFYIYVANNLQTGKTLRRVQARLFHFGPPTLCRVKDIENGETDLRDGEWVLFEVGRLASKEILGMMMPESIEIDESTAKVYRHNVQHGFLSLEIGSVTKAHEFGMPPKIPLPPPIRPKTGQSRDKR